MSSWFNFRCAKRSEARGVWALAVVYFGVAYGLYALAFYLSSSVAGFREVYLWWRRADRTGAHPPRRGPDAAGGSAIPVALHLDSPVLVMIPVTPAAMGVFSAIPSFWRCRRGFSPAPRPWAASG